MSLLRSISTMSVAGLATQSSAPNSRRGSSEFTPLLGSQHHGPGRRKSVPSTEDYFSTIIHSAPTRAATSTSGTVGLPANAADLEVGTGEEEDEEGEAEAEEEVPLRPGTYVVLMAMYVGLIWTSLDSTVLVASLGVIGAEFQVSNKLALLGTSYLITQTAAQPLFGTCSDIFGRRNATVFASAVFLLSIVACGLSQTYYQLLVARGLAGIGSAGLGVMLSIIASDLIPLRRRGIFQSVANISYNLGAALGGPLGGICSDEIGWRWGWLVLIPLGIIHFAVAYYKIENSFDPNFDHNATDTWKKFRQLDFLGTFTMVAGITIGLYAVSLGGNEYPWDSPVVYGSLIVSAVLLIAFVLLEVFVVKKPLLALELLVSRTPGFITLTGFLAVMSQIALVYSVPLWFSTIKGFSNTASSTYLVPIVVSTSAGALVTGIILNRTGRYKKLLISASAFNILGPVLMAFWDRNTTPQWALWLTMAFVGFGFGSLIIISSVALVSSVNPERVAAAIGSSYLFRSCGAVIGIGLSNAIQQNRIKVALSEAITGPGAEELIENLRRDMAYAWKLSPELRMVVLDIYQDASRMFFIGATFVAAAAFITSTLIREYPLPSRLDRKT